MAQFPTMSTRFSGGGGRGSRERQWRCEGVGRDRGGRRAGGVRRGWCVYGIAMAAVLLFSMARFAAALPSDPDSIFQSKDERRLVDDIQRKMHLFELDEALKEADEAVAKFPNGTESHFARLMVLQEMNRLPQALPAYRERAEKNPKDALSHLCLAYCYYLIGNESSGEKELKVALGAKPVTAEARHLEVMLARADPKRRSKANGLAAKFRHDFPDYARAYITEAGWLFSRDASTGRIKGVLDAALALPVPPADAFDLLDRLHARDSIWYDPATAIPLFDRALKIDPSRVDLALTRSYRMREAGEPTTKTLGARLAIVKEAPRYGRARIMTARLLMDLHRYSEAYDVLGEGLDVVKYQEGYAPRVMQMQAMILHREGKDDEAAAELQRLIQKYPMESIESHAQRDAVELMGRDPKARVHILDHVPFLTQKGNYCGPASLSMDLGYWGDELTQDAIARDIYTGVVGTAPQVIREYVSTHGFDTKSFEGSIESWKRCLDAGIPVLWLTRVPGGGGHYILVVGYDDVFRNFIVHNPHESTERNVSYDEIKERRSLIPNLTRSIAIVPKKDVKAVAVLAGLKTTLRLRVANEIFYLATASNLFKGLWPAIGVNLLVAAVLAVVLLLLMRTLTYPSMRWTGVLFVVVTLGAIGGLNYLVTVWRNSQVVSVLMGFYLAWATLVPLYLVCMALRWFSHDWFRPRELIGLAAAVFVSWAARGLIDDGYWQDRVPVVLIVLVFIGLLWNRWRMGLVIDRARVGPTNRGGAGAVGTAGAAEVASPENLLRPYARPTARRGGFYAAEMALVESRLGELNTGGALVALDRIRKGRGRWPERAVDTFDLLESAVRVIGATHRWGEEVEAEGGGTETEGGGTEAGDGGTEAGDGGTEAEGADAGGEASKGGDAAVRLLDRLAGSHSAEDVVGGLARVLLACHYMTKADFYGVWGEDLDRASRLAAEADEYFVSCRSWPLLPAVPRLRFVAYPHLLIRLAPLLLGRVAARLEERKEQAGVEVADPGADRAAFAVSAILNRNNPFRSAASPSEETQEAEEPQSSDETDVSRKKEATVPGKKEPVAERPSGDFLNRTRPVLTPAERFLSRGADEG